MSRHTSPSEISPAFDAGQIGLDAFPLQNVLDSMDDVFVIYSAAGPVVYANPRAVEAFGFDPTGQPRDLVLSRLGIRDERGRLIPPTDYPVMHALNGEPVVKRRIRVQNDTGQEKFYQISANPLISGDEITGAVVIWHDLTDREQIEAALRASEERFRLASEAMAGVLYDWDLRTGTVVRSPGNEVMLGTPAEGYWPDTNWWPERIHPDDFERVYQELHDAIDSGANMVAHDYRIRHVDGHWVHVWDQAAIVRDEEGQAVRIVGTTVDISDRVAAEQALHASEERFRTVLETSLDAAYRRDLRTDRYDYLSPVIERVLGVTAEQLSSMSVAEVLERIHPDDMPLIRDQLAEIRREGQGRLEYRFRDNQGQYRWVADALIVTYGPDGEQLYQTGTVRDIADQKQAEAALRESEGRFRQLADSMPQLVWTAAPDGSVDYFNERSRELFDLDHTDGGPWNWAPLLHPDDVVLIKQAYLDAMRTGEPYQVEHRVRTANGEHRWFLSRAVPVRNADGQIIKWYGTATDIHDSKLAHQALRESEEHFRVALTNSPIVVYTCDTNLRYTWVHNPTLGENAEAVLGRRDDELLPPENVAELIAFKQSVLESGKADRREIHIQKDGELIFDEYAEPLLDDAGNVVGLTVAAVNITERRQLEQNMRRASEYVEIQRQILDHRERERLQIARDLHDGPLQELIAASFSLSDTITRVTDPTITQYLAGLTDTLQGQISNIRTFCSDLRPPSLAPFGLERAISAQASRFRERHPHIELHLSLMKDGRALPEDLRMALYRIYQESLNNIIKHAQASQVEVTFHFDESEVLLEIRDNGQGFTLPATWVTLVREGHLGLAGIRERAETVGANVEICSSLGEGTTIRVLAPRSSPNTEQSLPA